MPLLVVISVSAFKIGGAFMASPENGFAAFSPRTPSPLSPLPNPISGYAYAR